MCNCRFLRVCRRRSVERREKLRRMERKQRLLDFRRRKENLNMVFLLFLCSLSLGATARFDRLMWEKTRSCDWWDRVTAQDWLTNFRTSKVTFDYLSPLHHSMQCYGTFVSQQKPLLTISTSVARVRLLMPLAMFLLSLKSIRVL